MAKIQITVEDTGDDQNPLLVVFETVDPTGIETSAAAGFALLIYDIVTPEQEDEKGADE
jgi:hypothetical protein